MNPVKVMFGFVPLLVFSLLITVVGAGWAAVAALFTAVVVIAVTGWDGVKIVPVVQAVILLVVEFAAFGGGPPLDTFLMRYAPAIAALLLGVFMIVTAARVPFTAQLARGAVPPELRHTRRFLDVDRRMSTTWGLAFLVLGLCHVFGAQIDTDSTESALGLAVNWALPLLAFWRAAVSTQRAVVAVHHDQAHLAGEVNA